MESDDEEQPGDHGVTEARHDHDADTWQPVGELARRQREQRHRHELGETDQAEIEGVVPDRVDLPADRDLRHLHRKPRAEHRGPEAAEVGV